MSPIGTSSEDRLTRLEELTFFQEERLKELDAALTAQQKQLDKLEKEFADATSVIRQLREKLGDQAENALPPHSMPERW
ncbi:MAG: SlyX family protein [Desulfovibrio sp.]|jgi:SlyX protein|uniref:SlyX family protein n=1 Tax=Desulfovibrio sp. TaxID=885 RepID=UPI00135E5B6B|nr:SlyX family protein [Desulfovibrio sp.]MTJ94100.1 SlyX family protein [Desulfovibrio sp.]